MQVAPTNATLYHFEGSVFASVAVLVSLEKGFTSEHLEYRSVDLLHGANFAPAYLRISPRGTVPALVIPYAATKTGERQFKALTSTVEIAQFLDSSTLSSSHAAIALSPATVIGAEISNKIIEKIHSSEADPNFLLMSFRSEEERLVKLAGVPGAFLTGRQAALEKYAQEAGDEDARLAIFYENTIKANGGLLALYEGKGDSKEFVQKSVKAWNEVGKVLGFLEGHLEKTTYLLGDQISLADLHAGAWLMRVLAVSGGVHLSEASSTLATLGKFPKLHVWTDTLVERESFKKVYKDGLH